MNFSKRSYQKELLDRDDIPFEDIKRNMYELNIINTYLGGHNITIQGLKKIIDRIGTIERRKIVVCEIGCGGGDNLVAIGKWCKKNNISIQLTGIDINHYCIKVANDQLQLQHFEFNLLHSDYKNVNFENQKPDIIFSSLFCHHFTDKELIEMLRWMQASATYGFFINDLHRHRLAYYSIKLITTLFSKSHLVKNDGPLSVKRGFVKNDWERLLNAAGIEHTMFSIEWKWAFRWLVVCPVYSTQINSEVKATHMSK